MLIEVRGGATRCLSTPQSPICCSAEALPCCLKVWTRNGDARNCHLYVDADAAVLKVIMDGAKDRQTLDDRMIKIQAARRSTRSSRVDSTLNLGNGPHPFTSL